MQIAFDILDWSVGTDPLFHGSHSCAKSVVGSRYASLTRTSTSWCG